MVQRLNKVANQWTDEELVKWADGTLYTGKNTDDGKVSTEALVRLSKVTDVATLKPTQLNAVKQLVRQHLDRPVEEEAETPPPATDTAPVPPEKPVEEPSPETPVEAAPVQQRDVQVLGPRNTSTQAPSSSSARYVRERMERYEAAMAPGIPQTEGSVMLQQRHLFGTIDLILRQEGKDFYAAYQEFLSRLQKYGSSAKGKGDVYSEAYLFRGLDLGTKTYQRYVDFLTMSKTLANPTTRGVAMRQTNIEMAMSGFANQAYLQKVTGFFTEV